MPDNVLVTGGAGFIGGHVAAAYLAAGYDVTVLDDLSTGRADNIPAGAHFVHADVRSPEARALVAEGKFTVVNHHAAQVDVRASVADPMRDGSVNVLGLLNLLEGARLNGVRRIIFASSGGAIYGDGAGLPTEESAAKLPASPYGAAKLASEYYLASFAQLHDVETVVLRYANVYGPRQRADGEGGVVAVFANRALQGAVLTVNGDGEQTRDMVYVEDVADANIAATRCATPPPPVASLDRCAYNIGTGVQTTVNRLAELIVANAGARVPIQHAPPKAGEIRYSALSADKAARELGWQPSRSLDAGIQATLSWLAGERFAAAGKPAPAQEAGRTHSTRGSKTASSG
jgi:UDP-glucose 4-epimerase